MGSRTALHMRAMNRPSLYIQTQVFITCKEGWNNDTRAVSERMVVDTRGKEMFPPGENDWRTDGARCGFRLVRHLVKGVSRQRRERLENIDQLNEFSGSFHSQGIDLCLSCDLLFGRFLEDPLCSTCETRPKCPGRPEIEGNIPLSNPASQVAAAGCVNERSLKSTFDLFSVCRGSSGLA